MGLNIHPPTSETRRFFRRGWFRVAAIGAASVGAVSPSAGAAVLHLKNHADVDRPTVYLGDVAWITGASAAKADALSKLVVARSVHGGTRITAAEVLFALATHGAARSMLASMQIQGASRCVISPTPGTGSRGAAPERAVTVYANRRIALTQTSTATAGLPVSQTTPGTPANAAAPAAASSTPAHGTLAGMVRRMIFAGLRAKSNRTKIRFLTLNPLLDSAIPAGEHWSCRNLGRGWLGVVEFQADLISTGGLVHQVFVDVNVKKRVRVLVAAHLIRRGDVLTPYAFRPARRWLDRAMPTLVRHRATISGQQALRTISRGTLLDQRDFKPVDLVHEGETVTVFFVSGPMRVKSTAVARTGGKLNATIALRNSGGKIFDATVTGRDTAVIGASN